MLETFILRSTNLNLGLNILGQSLNCQTVIVMICKSKIIN